MECPNPCCVFCGIRSISIYNGYTIDQQSACLTEIIKPLSIDAIDENSPFSYWDITSRGFWEKHSDKYDGPKLNEALLKNLKDLTEKLKKSHSVKSEMATKLVLRVIFIRYLIDRGVDLDYSGFTSDVETSRAMLLDVVKNKLNLYTLFAHLKVKFNGNLFDLSEDSDDYLITEIVLSEVADFLSGKIDTQSGQLCIYDMYDFNIIPVELISNIYEILLGAETRNRDNAFYTPHYLVDYILDSVISDHIREYGVCKVLDPACGSGIFLVESYRRMVEKKLIEKPFIDDDLFLQETLSHNIYGIDLNEEAIDVAIFSLYLAVLDYKNPRTLKSFQLPKLKGRNLLKCDFFDEVALDKLQSDSRKSPFEFIVGNPPWGQGTDLQADYNIKNGYKKNFDYKNDTCRAFILRSKDFCGTNTKCCLILKSTMLYMQKGPSKRFREYLLENVEITRVIEFSSVRDKIFEGADAPTIIFSYRFSNTNALEHYFQHISMKPNIFFHLFNIIVIEKTDIKYAQQRLLKQYDWAWKTIVYGFADDIYTISKLKAHTVEQAIKRETPAMICKTGVQYNDGERKDASHLRGRNLLISDNAIDHFLLHLNFTEFTKERIHRPRIEALFHAPYCLVMRGLDMADYTMKAAYSDVDFVFQEAVYAIKGSPEQKPLLLNLVGLLNSKAYAYFNLMLGSSLGIEREQRQTKEILSFPYVYDEGIVSQVDSIQQKRAVSGNFVVAEDASSEIEELNQSILAAFNLADNAFVDYALRIQIPQLARKNDYDVYRDTLEQDFKVYAERFYNHFSVIFAKVQKHIQIRVYPVIARYYSAFEVAIVDSKPKERTQFVYADADIEKNLLARLSAHQVNGQFYHLKDVLYFEENSFCIIKPRHYKNWHPAIAQLDLMEVADRILSEDGGNEE